MPVILPVFPKPDEFDIWNIASDFIEYHTVRLITVNTVIQDYLTNIRPGDFQFTTNVKKL